MKFTDGAWLNQKDVKIFHPVRVEGVDGASDSLTIYTSTRLALKREEMHDLSLLTVQFSSPMADVVRVKLFHFAGSKLKTPQFEIFEQANTPVQIQNDAEIAMFTSGRLSARILKSGHWRVEFCAEGKVISTSRTNSMALAEREGSGAFTLDQLSLGVGETVYGLGERFSAFVKNGQVVDIWNRDGGTCSEQAYKNIPFYLTNHGYGVFVNHPGPVSFEVASENVERVQFSVPGQSLEYFVIYGPSPKEILEKYTLLTGRPALPPAWSFGLWLSTSFTTFYDEATVTSFIQGMADRDLPLDVFHFDCFWMKEYNWCDFKWDPRTFPDPQAMLSRLKQRGLHISLWINSYIAQASSLFEEGARNGYLLKKPDAEVWQTDLWQPGMGIVDFTNPAARHWYQEKLRQLLKMGVDCFKSDFAERIPTDVVYWDGSDPQRMHNYYTFLYNRTVFEVIQQERGQGEAVLFARSATTGSQQYPVHWGGDNESSFESMAESLRGGLSLGLSGFGFWSHDIGGFEGTPPAAVYKRWIPFGLLSSHSRLHGNQSYRVPWLFDEEAVDVLRLFTKLKLRLMPYLYAQALQARDRGTPLMRAMLLEYPDDPACAYLDRQYMLGDSLLVAPVFSAEKEALYYLPAGIWTNFFTSETRSGPGWITTEHDFLSIPLWVRPNSIIPVGSRADRASYDYAEGVTLQVYQLQEGTQSVTIPTPEGDIKTRFDLTQTGRTLMAQQLGATGGSWQILLAGVKAVDGLSGGTAKSTPQGLRITSSGSQVMVRLI